ncbi:MAG: glycosyl hydrolase family 28 protein, partial [Verrucomicrobiota bacterium]
MIDVLQHGVIADGTTLNTAALQALIEECAKSGGGTLAFPAGRYLTGGLVLRDNIHLHLESGAFLLGSTNLDDYPLFDPVPVHFAEDQEGLRALIFAHKAHHIHLSGGGTIDGQGSELLKNSPGVRAGMPRNIWFGECEDVTVEGLRLRCSGFWMQHYSKCTRLRLRGLDVYNHGSCNNDGCDIDCCRDVIVSDCNIDSHDDALCLKSGNDRPTENVVITNCITRTHCNHFKTGTDSNGGFRNITVSNLQMIPSTVLESGAGTEGADWRGACGLALGCVDGGMLENISISHVQMDQVRVPFFIKLGDRGTPIHGTDTRLPVQYARGISISHVTARAAGSCGGYIMGLPEQPVRGVRIENCDLEFEGGGDDALAESAVALKRDAYPSCDAFGSLPAFALFLRDAAEVQLANLTLRTLKPDARP